jgi:hypothetical protein
MRPDLPASGIEISGSSARSARIGTAGLQRNWMFL